MMNRTCEKYFQKDILEPDNTTIRQAYYAGFRRGYNLTNGQAEWKLIGNAAICTHCNFIVVKYIGVRYDFCPRCGLRMWENKNNE